MNGAYSIMVYTINRTGVPINECHTHSMVLINKQPCYRIVLYNKGMTAIVSQGGYVTITKGRC